MNAAIRDHATTTSTITLPPSPALPAPWALRMALQLEHSWAADLLITLTAPTGETAVLLNRSGGGTDLRGVYVVADAAPVYLPELPIIGPSFPPVAALRPSAASAPLPPLASVFDGVDGGVPAGDWVLSLADLAELDTGVLRAWSLELVTSG